ncbi:hypothetical protein M434DRAFT_345004 [Hypoxylon sp. CO27-5]|nr:hypothetical protein M434DRAFT_345004 [Hypoxylon sp. CO27-5]
MLVSPSSRGKPSLSCRCRHDFTQKGGVSFVKLALYITLCETAIHTYYFLYCPLTFLGMHSCLP